MGGHLDDLLAYLAAAPSPYHAAAEAALRLATAGSEVLDPTAVWPSSPGRYHVVRDGSLVAWVVGPDARPDAPVRLIGAHTDSPNLRVKPNADTGHAGWRQLGVEVYGGALYNSWLDRDLGLSGRVTVREGNRATTKLVKVDRPIARVPQLAIHLDRDVNTKGLALNAQQHLAPVWALGEPEQDGIGKGGFTRFLASELSEAGDGAAFLDPADIVAWDLMFHDTTPPAIVGRDGELVSSGRLDNLCSCHAAVSALIAAGAEIADGVAAICLFDHEEVGSTSATGAAGAWLAHVLERAALARGASRDDWLRSLAGSLCASADMAHATHPNYADRHEPEHHVAVNGGPVIKVNASQRYATDAASDAAFALACEKAGVGWQRYVNRSDLPCGSTIGPLTAARLGIATVDVGVAQLAMHSARELCGAEDPERMARALTAFLAPAD